RTELKFPGEGIAAVVGPNGCGKSNISDSISWVLGEQSAKSLRGVRMEDVIFAGTRDRKPTGMAEVSLTLIDPQVYEGDVSAQPEIDVQDDMPSEDDWDEASVRATAADATDAHVAEVQPGPLDWKEGMEGEPSDVESAAEASPDTAEQPASTDPNAPDGQAAQTNGAVVLKIRRRKFKPLAFAKGEVMVTRRLFRTGESEYLLNGKLCRLRDIQDIFMGTGLGPESYAIIEQGRIGQILSSKPYDRRAIIEEAAGVSKYKAKKRLAEARLEASRLNLSRINDIFEEVTRQVGSLKRQAAKAQRYQVLKAEFDQQQQLLLRQRAQTLAAAQEQLQAQHEQVQGAVRTSQAGIERQEAARAEAARQCAQIERELRHMTEEAGRLQRELEHTRQQIVFQRQQAEELGRRGQSSREECARVEAQGTALGAELEQAR